MITNRVEYAHNHLDEIVRNVVKTFRGCTITMQYLPETNAFRYTFRTNVEGEHYEITNTLPSRQLIETPKDDFQEWWINTIQYRLLEMTGVTHDGYS